jgi:hypothetical protein
VCLLFINDDVFLLLELGKELEGHSTSVYLLGNGVGESATLLHTYWRER